MELCGGNAHGWEPQDELPWNVCPGERSQRRRLVKELSLGCGAAGGHLICPKLGFAGRNSLKGWVFTEKEHGV